MPHDWLAQQYQWHLAEYGKATADAWLAAWREVLDA